MRRLLNQRIGGLSKVVVAQPCTEAFAVKNRAFVLDVNSLLLIEAESIDIAEKIVSQSPPPNMLLNAAYAPYREKPTAKSVQKLALNVTQECNLRCSYCFSKHEKGQMDNDIIKASLKLIRNASCYDISFFGGEPLVGILSIENAVTMAGDLAREFGKKTRFHITTNAILMDDGIAPYLAAEGFTAIVSLDGPEQIHDMLRGESWRETLAGLQTMNRHGMKDITLRATYTPECLRLVERAEFLYQLQKRGLAANFSIEPASGQAWDPLALEEAYDELGAWYVDKIKKKEIPRLYHFSVYLDRLRNAKPHLACCGAGNAYVSVGPDGTIYACHRQGGSKIGHVDSGIDEALQQEWLDNRFYNHKECNDCWAKHLCGGGCRESHCHETGERSWPGTLCIPIRTIIKQCTWILAELTGDGNGTTGKR